MSEYLLKRGWKPDENGNWIDPAPDGNWPTTPWWVVAERRQKDRDAAALDRIIAFCADRERVGGVAGAVERSGGVIWHIFNAASATQGHFCHPCRICQAKIMDALAAEIARLAGGEMRSAKDE